MGGRGKAPLAPLLLHGLPLGMQVEGDRAGTTGAGRERHAASDDEAKARHPLNALVGRADEKLDAKAPHVDGDTAKAAHGIDDQANAAALAERSHLLKGVEHAGGGLAVHHGQMGDLGVAHQHRLDGGWFRAGGLAAVELMVAQAKTAGHLPHAGTVGAVVDDQQTLIDAYRRAQHTLHHIAAAPLQQHGAVVTFIFRAGGEAHQLAADGLHHTLVVVRIPGTAVLQHGGAYRRGGREGARGQQQVIDGGGGRRNMGHDFAPFGIYQNERIVGNCPAKVKGVALRATKNSFSAPGSR